MGLLSQFHPHSILYIKLVFTTTIRIPNYPWMVLRLTLSFIRGLFRSSYLGWWLFGIGFFRLSSWSCDCSARVEFFVGYTRLNSLIRIDSNKWLWRHFELTSFSAGAAFVLVPLVVLERPDSNESTGTMRLSFGIRSYIVTNFVKRRHNWFKF